jgi:hypothetical protein
MKGDMMRNPDSDDDLDALLRSAATVQRDLAEEERLFSDVWSRVQASIGDDGGTTFGDALQERRLNLIADREMAARRRRRATRLASAALAIAVAGGGTAAAAEYISTRTGEQTTGWEVDAAGAGELLDLGGTDRRQVFEEVTADIPFPPGYEAQRTWALDFHSPETDSRITESNLRSWMAANAVCTWADAWVAADDAGDVTARADAGETLAEAVSWDDIRLRDFPDAVILESGERLSYRWWVRPLAEAAGSGNRQALLETVAYGAFCSYHVMPVIDAAPDYEYQGVR